MTDFETCSDCVRRAVWERVTQFAGIHPYCAAHAVLEKDFGKEDDQTLWRKIADRPPKSEKKAAPQVRSSSIKVHHLKEWPKFFCAVRDGWKTFEVRKDDRGFKECDILILQEYDMGGADRNEGYYTGREMAVEITYIMREFVGLKEGYCILGIRKFA